MLKKVDNFISIAYLFNFLRAVQLKVVMGVMISLWSYKDNKGYSGASKDLILTIISLLAYIGVVISVIIAIQHRSRAQKAQKFEQKTEKNEINKKAPKVRPEVGYLQYLKAEEEFRLGTPENKEFGEWCLLVTLITDYAIPVSLVVAIELPWLQIISTLITMTINLLIIIFKRPYKEGYRNLLEVVNKSIYILLMLTFAIFHSAGAGIHGRQRYYFFGYLTIFLLVVLLGFNFVMIFVAIVKKWREKKKKGDVEALEEDGKEQIQSFGQVDEEHFKDGNLDESKAIAQLERDNYGEASSNGSLKRSMLGRKEGFGSEQFLNFDHSEIEKEGQKEAFLDNRGNLGDEPGPWDLRSPENRAKNQQEELSIFDELYDEATPGNKKITRSGAKRLGTDKQGLIRRSEMSFSKNKEKEDIYLLK